MSLHSNAMHAAFQPDRGESLPGAGYDALRRVSRAIAAHHDTKELFRSLADELRSVVNFVFLRVFLYDKEHHLMRLHVSEAPGQPPAAFSEFPPEGTAVGWVYERQEPLVIPDVDKETRFPRLHGILKEYGIRSHLTFPLTTAHGRLGTFAVGSNQVDAYYDEDVRFLALVADQIAIAVDNAIAYGQIAKLKNELAQEKLYLESEIRSEMNFADIVGNSPTIRAVLGQVEMVAPSDSTVLLLGETGTGKELMARAIHERSQRRSHAFVKLNCAAIPTGLLESEMFGHERGAFTGAVAQRVGRFELANGGTIFLDEIGEIPLELQPKLLRVLQEREFERLGSSRTMHSDARLVAATNCDLQGMVDERKFRADLYYRLNVFPIFIPALRERREDIPLLVSHFTQLFAHRLNKKIEKVPSEAMNALIDYSWPGNIRELQNVIERAVLVSNGPLLRVSLADLKTRPASARGRAGKPESRAVAGDPQPIRDVLEDVERKQILAALEQSHGVVAGPNGAAARLGLKRSTLQLRMKKLGISSHR